MTNDRTEINEKINQLEQQVDLWATGISWLWHELEQRYGADEAVRLRTAFGVVVHHTEPQVEQALRVAQMSGAASVWLVRGATGAALAVDFVRRGTQEIPEHVLQLEPPHPLILLAIFPQSDGGEAGIEVR